MQTSDFVRLFVAVVAVSSVCKSTVTANINDQHGGRATGTGQIHYSREVLLRFRSLATPLAHPLDDFPNEMKPDNSRSGKKKKGTRGGVKRRLRKYKHAPPLPSIVVSNVRSIRPNSDNMNFEEL
jgi:hypothetical protein